MRKPASKAQPRTATAPAAQPAPDWPWQKRRDWFKARFRVQPPPGLAADELEAHFTGMPAHYWKQVNEADLLWGLASVHEFLKLVTSSSVPVTKPYMDARQIQPPGHTRVMLCTWDRLGLLAKAAAALSELHLNILAAEAFTRADDLVLDVFTVVDLESGGAASAERLKEAHFLLEGALSEPPRFASIWMCSRHKYVLPASQFAPQLRFDNDASETATLVHIEAADRLGLLYDILHTLTEAGLNVAEAHINTEGMLARDVVHIRDAKGQKITVPERLEELRSHLTQALTMSAG
jgi:[protein-PII] uridylyltransferase